MKGEEDSGEEIGEDEAWRLMMEEDRLNEGGEPLVVNLVRRETLLTQVKIDLKNGNMMEGEAVVDTGSVLSFLSASTIRSFAPELLKELNYYPVRITGISGENVDIMGTLLLPLRGSWQDVSA